jgi:hypothetical protein
MKNENFDLIKLKIKENIIKLKNNNQIIALTNIYIESLDVLLNFTIKKNKIKFEIITNRKINYLNIKDEEIIQFNYQEILFIEKILTTLKNENYFKKFNNDDEDTIWNFIDIYETEHIRLDKMSFTIEI